MELTWAPSHPSTLGHTPHRLTLNQGGLLSLLAPPSSPTGPHLGSAPQGHTPGEELQSEKSQPSLAESARFCSSGGPGGPTWPQSVLPAP